MKLTFMINFIFFLLIGNSIKISEQYNVKLRLGLCSYTFTNEKTAKTKISGHYWRPYNGVIPSDAIPGGKIKNSVGYVASVYDPVNKGEFLTTIRQGETDVTVTINKKSTLRNHIQILCTEEKDKFQWLAMTDPKIANGTLITGGMRSRYHPLYVSQAKDKNGDLYVGNINNRIDGVLYTTSDGKAERTNNTEEYKVLYYFNYSKTSIQEEPFITYGFHTSFKNPTGPAYFPNFYYMVKVWNLIAVCTDDQNTPGNEMAYYWKPKQPKYVPDDAFILGTQFSSYEKEFRPQHVGQFYYETNNEIIQGTFRTSQEYITSLVFIPPKTTLTARLYEGGKFLCTSNNNTFEWVNTTIKDASKLLSKAVLGGCTNVSAVYIARVERKKSIYLASLYPTGDDGKPTISYFIDYDFFTDVTNFELLTYVGPKESDSNESIVSTLWRYLGFSLTL